MENANNDKSKTEKKKEAEELQKLGLELNKLSVQQLRRVDIPEDLRTALIEGKNITSNVAGRRHRQFIGALMREVDPDIIHQALLQAENEFFIDSEKNKASLVWVDRLMRGDMTDVEALISECPGLERQRLRQLVRNIKNAKPGPKAVKARKAIEQYIMSEVMS